MRTKSAGVLPTVTAFISYSHEDREYAGQTKAALSTFGISAFLAHEDIDVSHDWRDRILEELQSCELFVPLLSERFLSSKWAPQEVGFIVSRPSVKIMPISIDKTVPCGFISNLQSKRIQDDKVTSDFLLPALVHNFPRCVFPHLIERARLARDFRTGEARIARIRPYFGELTPTEARTLAEVSRKSIDIWDATECREVYLPEFIRVQGKHIGVQNRHALQHQINTRDWYSPEEHE